MLLLSGFPHFLVNNLFLVISELLNENLLNSNAEWSLMNDFEQFVNCFNWVIQKNWLKRADSLGLFSLVYSFMSREPEMTQRSWDRLSYSWCTILETALLHTCNLFLCISVRWEVVHSQCSRLWLSSLTPMTAAVISQQLIRALLILSAQEKRARERDTGLVCIRG